ncbi:MAG: Gfo/Idh/MocA family oxidoreductase [Oscillospiraceae bacterium]|jgi:predicted dehydrogenase|nr:Gfo/Idh/MocA family oxidoreductase [Oscillospiraceae bacterium]
MPTLAAIGLGNRGRMYLNELRRYKDVEVTALCDTNPINLEHTVGWAKPKQQFSTEDDFFTAGRLADWLIIGSPDLIHYRHTKRAITLGYDILLEKPVTPNPAELDELCELADANGNTVLVCHVLRYTPFFRTIKDIVQRGEIGDVMNIVHEENTGYWHFAHSFVRGTWRRLDESAPYLLAKACHDFDLLHWFMDKPCENVSAYGKLTYFHSGNKPADAPPYCLDGCPRLNTCPYSVEKLYLSKKTPIGWGIPTVSELPYNPGKERTRKVLRKGQYGRCVFQCDNDVADNHSAIMRFADGSTASMSVSAFNNEFSRRIHVMGTKGELYGRDDTMHLQKRIWGSKPETLKIREIGKSGHGGGDAGLTGTVHALMTGQSVPRNNLTTLQETRYSHRIVYAALESIKSGQTVQL